MPIRIDALDPTGIVDEDMVLPVMLGGQTYKLTLAQIVSLFYEGAPADLDTWLEMVAALNDKHPLIHNSSGKSLLVDADEIGGTNSANAFAAIKVTLANLRTSLAADPWAFQPVGAYVWIDDAISGLVEPPKDKAYRYIKCTAGLTGVGAYNEGCLSGESVTGSAPLIVATANVSLSGSPFVGQSQRLLNTEKRSLRPGVAGTLENDAIQNIVGSFDLRKMNDGSAMYTATTGAFTSTASGGGSAPRNSAAPGATLTADLISFSAANDTNVRTATETRVRGMQVSLYRRIK